MAVDQRIQTTITAGRRSSGDFDQGPIMIILLGCLAVAMCFTTLGMGFVNIARSASMAKAAANAEPDKVPAVTKPIEDPDAELKRTETMLRNQIAALTEREKTLTGQKQAVAAAVDSTLQSLSVERTQFERNKETLKALETQKQQLTAKVSEVQTKLAGRFEEEQRQVQLRTQLDRQLADIRGQVAQASRRVQELRESIDDRKNSLSIELLSGRNGKPTVWVECTSAAIVLLPQESRVSLTELGDPRAGFLKTIQGRHVEFLIRPEGFEAFRLAREIAEQHGASTIGYEPVDANWRLKY